MNKFYLSIAALFLFSAVEAQAQTARVYSCPTTVLPGGAANSTGVINSRADNHTSCPSWTWVAPPRRDADLPLVGACTTCNWNAGSVTWKRPRDVLVTERVTTCTGTQNGDNCSPQSFVLRDSALLPPVVTNPPVNCVLGNFALKTTGAWGACLSPGTRTRTDIWERPITTPASNGGTACPVPLPTESRVVIESCTVPLVALSTTFDTIYTGDSVPLTWFSTGVTSCTASWDSNPINLQQPTPVIVGPFTFPQTLQFTLSCVGPNQPVTSTIPVTVRLQGPTAWAHLDDWLAGRIKWDFIQTPGTKYDLKATYFTPVRQETWATTWEEILARADAERRGVPYDEAAARAQCEIECEFIDPTTPLGIELTTFRNSVTPAEREEMGIVE